MILQKFFSAAAIGVALLSGGTAMAATTASLTESLTSRGGDINFNFTGLGPSDGTDGTLTLVGVNMDYAVASNEFFDLEIDGTSFGRFACAGSSAVATIIAGSNFNCDFTLSVTIGGAALAGFLSDGTVSVDMLSGFQVDPFSGNQVTATLSYNDAVSAVPLPASSLLLLGGLGGIVALRRRRKAA